MSHPGPLRKRQMKFWCFLSEYFYHLFIKIEFKQCYLISRQVLTYFVEFRKFVKVFIYHFPHACINGFTVSRTIFLKVIFKFMYMWLKVWYTNSTISSRYKYFVKMNHLHNYKKFILIPNCPR